MRSIELSLARLQLANDCPHDPSANRKVLLCDLFTLSLEGCALCGEISYPGQ
jgi:hypothetical protein